MVPTVANNPFSQWNDSLSNQLDFISPPAAHCILSPLGSLGIISNFELFKILFFSRFHFLIAKEQNWEARLS
ncbi:hypothetical protein L1987_10172 [Smallanthus sonchifolius]|uniref:Uncharacterized protein n=1 Tax=Smallanthus sonchifolius TaxID=185202 RepID=A0ACB9JRC2_9ASTR|nr:hypothetical protein L1987_10172 [Smallanthus sonchifolius]